MSEIVMKFGKYRGKPISEIEDKGYLEWLLKTKVGYSRLWNKDHKDAVNEKIKQIECYGR